MAGPITLGLGVGTSYYQHSTSTTSPQDFQSRLIEPLIRFDRDTDRSRILVEARRRLDLYSGEDLGQTLGGTRQVADHAELQLRQTWSENARLDAGGSFLSSSDALDVDQPTLAVQSPFQEWGGNVGANLGRVQGSYRARGWSYDNPLLLDATAHNWAVRVLPVRRTEDTWFAGWRQGEQELESRTALGSQVGSVGFRRPLGPGISAEAEAGASEVSYADGSSAVGPEAAFALDGPEGGRTALSARVQFERVFPTTFSARASRGFGDGQMWLSAESLVDVEGGYYRYPTFVRHVGVGFLDTLGRATVIGFEASTGHVRPYLVAGPTAEIVQASGWLARRVRPWLTGRAGCSYLNQTEDGVSGALSFRRVRVDAALIALRP
jgi:hypothetical protein